MSRRADRARTTAGVGATLAVVASALVWSAHAEPPPVAGAVELPTLTAPAPAPTAGATVDRGGAATVVRPERCAATSGKTVLVDLSEQTMWLCRRGVAVGSAPVTTGSDEHLTPTGRWQVYAKQTDRWLSGEGYSRQVEYWMPFFEGYGFHDSAWQEIPYGSPLVHDEGSHGCVHVPHAMMKRLYRWADVGTTVRIVT